MTRRILTALLPFALVALLFRLMGLVKNWGLEAGRVHLCDLRQHEIALFGIHVGGRPATVHDWLQPHAMTALDLLCALPYGAYLIVVISYGVWLALADVRDERDMVQASRAARLGWGFFALNLAGFLTYHAYPAAPPWYYHSHGCNVDLQTPPSPGPNLTRVDGMTGVPLFARLYAQSSVVFGSVPSLHVSYPLLMLLTGWGVHGAVGRGLLIAYWLLMCFSAVYLDHHWVIDVLLGQLYALTAFGLVLLVSRRISAMKAAEARP